MERSPLIESGPFYTEMFGPNFLEAYIARKKWIESSEVQKLILLRAQENYGFKPENINQSNLAKWIDEMEGEEFAVLTFAEGKNFWYRVIGKSTVKRIREENKQMGKLMKSAWERMISSIRGEIVAESVGII
jgi:hypothetical protein